MSGLDAIDREVLQLLMEDARRSYREIAEEVERSPPTVAERVDHLQDIGVIKRFTLDIDQSMLVDRSALLIEFDVHPGDEETIAEAFANVAQVEHLIRMVDPTILLVAQAEERRSIPFSLRCSTVSRSETIACG